MIESMLSVYNMYASAIHVNMFIYCTERIIHVADYCTERIIHVADY